MIPPGSLRSCLTIGSPAFIAPNPQVSINHRHCTMPPRGAINQGNLLESRALPLVTREMQIKGNRAASSKNNQLALSGSGVLSREKSDSRNLSKGVWNLGRKPFTQEICLGKFKDRVGRIARVTPEKIAKINLCSTGNNEPTEPVSHDLPDDNFILPCSPRCDSIKNNRLRFSILGDMPFIRLHHVIQWNSAAISCS